MKKDNKINLVLLFLIFCGSLQAQEITKRDSAKTTIFPELQSEMKPDSMHNPVAFSIKRALFRSFYQNKDTIYARNWQKELQLDPWLASALGADLDPFIHRTQFIPLWSNGDWKTEMSVFADKGTWFSSQKFLLYSTGFHAVYQDRWMIENLWIYNVDQYSASLIQAGYILDPFTFRIRQSFFWINPGVIPPDNAGNYPKVIKETDIGINMKITDNIQLDAFQQISPGNKKPFIGIRFSK